MTKDATAMAIPAGAQGAPRWRIAFDWPARLKAAAIGAVFVGVFWNLLAFWPPDALGKLVYAWVNQPDWSHGPIIPLFSAYLVYMNWDRITRCPVRYTGVGLLLLLAGLTLYLWTFFGLSFDYAQPLSMMLTLLGVVLYVCGLPILSHVWLPWLYLFFAIPLPQRIYFGLTDPLRRIAAEVAQAVLSLIPRLSIERVGSNLEFIRHDTGMSGVIGVADACSGMRSTVTLCALGVAVAFLSPRPWPHRIILIAACVPIATFCNFIRVTITCWLHIFVDPKYASGTYHMMLGLAMLLLAFAIFSGIGWILSNLYIEERDAPDPAPAS